MDRDPLSACGQHICSLVESISYSDEHTRHHWTTYSWDVLQLIWEFEAPNDMVAERKEVHGKQSIDDHGW